MSWISSPAFLLSVREIEISVIYGCKRQGIINLERIVRYEKDRRVYK